MLFLIFTHREKESERALDNFCELDVLGTVFLVEEQLFEVIVKQGIKQKLLERYLSISNTLDPRNFSFDNGCITYHMVIYKEHEDQLRQTFFRN